MDKQLDKPMGYGIKEETKHQLSCDLTMAGCRAKRCHGEIRCALFREQPVISVI